MSWRKLTFRNVNGQKWCYFIYTKKVGEELVLILTLSISRVYFNMLKHYTRFTWTMTAFLSCLWMSDNEVWYKDISALTRLHSSRMHTARVLTVSPSIHCAGGCLLLGGVCSGGSAPGGGVPTCLLLGWGVVWYPSMHWGRPPCDRQNDRQAQKYYLAPNFVCGR